MPLDRHMQQIRALSEITEQLPMNYVKLKGLKTGNAQIESGSGWSIKTGYASSSNKITQLLVWTGKLTYGSKNVSTKENASLHTNTLPSVTLRFPNTALKADGTSADVLMTLSEIKYSVGKPKMSGITNNSNVQVCIYAGTGNFIGSAPKTGWSIPSPTEKNYNVCCTTCVRFKATFRIVEPGTNTSINASQFPTMNIHFKDLDVASWNTRSGAKPTERFTATWAESIEMVDGWSSPIVLAGETSDLANTCLVNPQSVNGNTRIVGNGPLLENFVETYNMGEVREPDSLYSGFVAGVSTQGFSLYWTGSVGGKGTMATKIGAQPTVTVRAMRHGKGAPVSMLGGSGQSNVETWFDNVHLMNSSATYTAIPGKEFYITSFKVDGVEQAMTTAQKKSGFSYVFRRLVQSPFRHRSIVNSQVYEDPGESSFYTVEATYEHLPKYKAEKVANKANIRLNSDEEITYQIACEEIFDDAPEGTHVLHDNLAGGLLKVDPDSILTTAENGTVTYNLTSNGIDITFRSNGATSGKPKMSLSYKATVDWDKYQTLPATSVTNSLVGYNEPQAGGNRTGNDVTFTVSSDMILKKEIAGKLRDDTKKFEFEVSLTGLKPNTVYRFETMSGATVTKASLGTLSDGSVKTTASGEATILVKAAGKQGIEFLDLPIGSRYRVREATSDHIASYKITTDTSDPVIVSAEKANTVNKKELSTSVETIDKKDGLQTVTFTNTRNAAPVTGVNERGGWAVASAAIITGLLVIVTRRWRKRNLKNAE